MTARTQVGIEQARASLPALVEQARAGRASVITRHGQPVAAVVPLDMLRSQRAGDKLLSLRGSGAGLWGPQVGQRVQEMRDEWD